MPSEGVSNVALRAELLSAGVRVARQADLLGNQLAISGAQVDGDHRVVGIVGHESDPCGPLKTQR
jgi:hypothetical protein